MLLHAQYGAAPSAITGLSLSPLQPCTPLLLGQGCAVCVLLSFLPHSFCSSSLIGWGTNRAMPQRTITLFFYGGPNSNGAWLHSVVGCIVPAA